MNSQLLTVLNNAQLETTAQLSASWQDAALRKIALSPKGLFFPWKAALLKAVALRRNVFLL